MWHRRQILVIEEELLEGDELLDAAQDAVTRYDFKMTESFAAKVGVKVARFVVCTPQKYSAAAANCRT